MGRIQGDLTERTFRFALRVIDLIDRMPQNTKGWEIGRQLLRSGTSIGANLHEADQALTKPDFVHRCSIARKESSETNYWLRICSAKQLLPAPDADDAATEADEFTRILTAIIKKCQTQPGSPE